MSRSLDPEDVHSMLERFYAAADEIVERFGGSIDKHIGDSVMAVFGAPVAHDDDAIRAVRAAAEIHRAMPSVGGATASRWRCTSASRRARWSRAASAAPAIARTR